MIGASTASALVTVLQRAISSSPASGVVLPASIFWFGTLRYVARSRYHAQMAGRKPAINEMLPSVPQLRTSASAAGANALRSGSSNNKSGQSNTARLASTTTTRIAEARMRQARIMNSRSLRPCSDAYCSQRIDAMNNAARISVTPR